MKLIFSFLIIITFIGCSGVKNSYKLEKESALNFKEAYYQEWVAGVEGGGSGITIVLEPSPETKLKGIYFKETYTELKTKKANNYVGHIKGEYNWLEGDKVVKEKVDTPFTLIKNEAVISFMHKGKLKYIKIELPKKPMKELPQ